MLPPLDGPGVRANFFFLIFLMILMDPSMSSVSNWELSTRFVWHRKLSFIVNFEDWVWEGAVVRKESFSRWSRVRRFPETVSHWRILCAIIGVLGRSISSEHWSWPIDTLSFTETPIFYGTIWTSPNLGVVRFLIGVFLIGSVSFIMLLKLAALHLKAGS